MVMSVEPLQKRPRSSRWDNVDIAQHEKKNLLARLDRITQVIDTNCIPVDQLCRSPSPEPRYDSRGKRVNTRHDRALDKLEMERFKLSARLKDLDSYFRPPRGMRTPRVVDKLYIPKEKEGTLNFIGLILGPRGNTQKRLEKDYQCKVAIRGKGSVKDGRARGPAQPEDNEQLHVIITAEGIDAKSRIEQCKLKIMDIITPRQDDDNDHKQAQLRELAQLNGTLRDQNRNFERRARNVGNGISCSICGDTSHPSSDCPQKDDTDADLGQFVAHMNGEAGIIAGEGKQLEHTSSRANGVAPWLRPGSFALRPPHAPPPGPPPQAFGPPFHAPGFPQRPPFPPHPNGDPSFYPPNGVGMPLGALPQPPIGPPGASPMQEMPPPPPPGMPFGTPPPHNGGMAPPPPYPYGDFSGTTPPSANPVTEAPPPPPPPPPPPG